MFDLNLMLINSTADVTASVTGSSVDFRGEDATMMFYRVVIPAVAADTSAIVKIQESDNGTDWNDLVSTPSITAAGDYHVHARSKKQYRRAILTPTGSSLNFGKVLVGAVPAGNYRDW